MMRVKVNINQLYFGKDNNQDTFHGKENKVLEHHHTVEHPWRGTPC